MSAAPTVGIVGLAGAYGRWLERFFRERMGLAVIGCDPALPDGPSAREVRDRADVLLFAVPIRHTARIIAELAADMPERGVPPLWLDVTSIKQAPVAAMQAAPVEVLGLHPMAAPPKSPTLKGRVLVVCEGRLDHWRGFTGRLLDALEAQCVHCAPTEHDQIMARVQALAHAAILSLAGVLAEDEAPLSPPAALLPYRTPIFELANAMMTRILSSNPQIYEDIQFGSQAVAPILDRLAVRTRALADLVADGDEAAREAFRTRFLDAPRSAFGGAPLGEGNAGFERLAWLLADLAEPRCLALHLPEDRPGALRAVLADFEQHGISIESIHSSRSPEGDVQFRIGFSRQQDDTAIRAASARLETAGLACVISLQL
ncbi:prephenate dehydrogenase [Pseudomarimonas salicorniae]|uniref:Prephenate dehydrogenase n=1 Tax=Pseudomarimonas salicorniae TaxID=2933270 RepID=A0ABT0GDY8_9GAMM|nr:prephenate dehydrogenase [Lysobacter sp. CAU 1642]MCK7592774.1 prephenate dehydrogenase [Lysobacter sp. CAU 1642]